jgi:hypothetical protein
LKGDYILSNEDASKVLNVLYNDLRQRFPTDEEGKKILWRDIPYKDREDGEPYIAELTLLKGGKFMQAWHTDYKGDIYNGTKYQNLRFKPGSMLIPILSDSYLWFTKKSEYPPQTMEDVQQLKTKKKLHLGMAVFFQGHKIHAGAKYNDECGLRMHLHIDCKGLTRKENEIGIVPRLQVQFSSV